MALVVAGAVLGTLPSATFAADEQTDRPAGQGRLGHAMDRDALARMHADAEEAYRARRWSDAMQAYNAIVVLEPNHAQAWLRIGNLHHRRNQLLSAASAYRKAARRAASQARSTAAPDASVTSRDALPAPIDPFDAFSARREPSDRSASTEAGRQDHTRAKALINLALVNVELAQSALAEIGDVPAELVEAHDEAVASLGRARGQVERRRLRESPSWRTTRRTDERSSPSERPRPAGIPTARDRPSASQGPSSPEIEYLDGGAKP